MLSVDDYGRFTIIWEDAVNQYIDTAMLDKEELDMIKEKEFGVEDFFLTMRKDWELAAMRSSNSWKYKLNRILMDLLEKNNIIDTLTDWAKNAVRFKIVYSLTRTVISAHTSFVGLYYCSIKGLTYS